MSPLHPGNIIELKDVRFSYNGEDVLSDITLSVEEGDFLAVIGPNGGGKTTFLKLVLGLLRPKTGTVRVFGEEPKKSAMRLGYVPQDTSTNREFPIQVFDVTLMGRIGHAGTLRHYSDADRDAVRHSLETVGMWNLRKRRIGTLSGGERQRVFIARALASEPDALLLDEPTSSIDIEGQRMIYEILKMLNNRMTVIVVSHDISILLGYAKTVAHVNKTLYLHSAPIVTTEMLSCLRGYSAGHICPIELLSSDLLAKHTRTTGE